uniref:Geranylgeranylglyceryl phosphate synthase n=1 Tax=uncultured marine group II/III euryarchaeote KM3_115_A12 TaxID=1457854 RepID=A0A075G7Q1_9EURY|nr:geranylgeranylglyceryl phosphate synthase (pcrB) [uncultured marine group II/III euryarchaeote KM3_115_A12]
MRPSTHDSIIDYIRSFRGTPQHIILIDPDDVSPEVAASRCVAAVSAGSKMIFVGGSTGTDNDNVHNTCVAIQEALELCVWNSSQDSVLSEEDWRIPVVLFPAGANALSTVADAITFMMLMNSNDRRFLVGEQIQGAPHIRKAGIEPLSMGYVVCAPGGKVGEVGAADLIEPNATEKVASYSMCAEAYNFSILYLEAGSGAHTPVSPDLIRAAKAASENLIILVGGGIKDGTSALAAIEAGADWVVTGNLTEQFDDAATLQSTLESFITQMNG